MKAYEVIVIGGGPAGLAAALAAHRAGGRVLIIEREERLGGILKQCIHDGFGLVRFGEKLSGPEYAERFIDEVLEMGIDFLTSSFVTELKKDGEGFCVSVVNRDGVTDYQAGALVLATGCRERTARQVLIHGTRPAGIFTAGTAQHFTNLLGQLPTKRCVILGSGDIGLIMARRLTLEGAEVLGVYEAKPSPSGLTRNLVQCLEDFDIPLYLSHTVTRVFGEERLTAVEVAQVDGQMKPVPGTSRIIECDGLILSVGLIPENEAAGQLGVPMDIASKGPVCDNRFMTQIPGVFSCGNALHVNDLVDYVSESGELAGKNAAAYAAGKAGMAVGTSENAGKADDSDSGVCLDFSADDSFLYLVPHKLRWQDRDKKAVLYFRSREVLKNAVFTMSVDGEVVYTRKYSRLKPPEMERLEIDFGKYPIQRGGQLRFEIKEGME